MWGFDGKSWERFFRHNPSGGFTVLLSVTIGVLLGLMSASIATLILVVFGLDPDLVVAVWSFVVGFIVGAIFGWEPE